MSRGISLHIGLNYVNPQAYNGWDGALAGCINDANDMHQIAMSQNFEGQVLTDSQATSSKIVTRIAEIANELQSGDIFLLTYSGHGGQLPDLTGEEEDGMDETWVLWDRELLDNELYALWSRFASGVRIFVSSDSCHSGTVVRMMYRRQMRQRNAKLDIESLVDVSKEMLSRNRQLISTTNMVTKSKQEPKQRFIPIDVSMRSFDERREEYSYCANMAGRKSRNQINANLIFISGCQDNQYSYDGDQNGLFTSKLLQVWANSSFNGSHQTFHNEISALMPSYQTPNFMMLGIPITGFANQKPYTVQFGTGSGTSGGGTSTTQQKPSVLPPVSWGRNNVAPTVRVNKGVNPYYYLEVTSDYRLFNYSTHGSSRTANNFYATWADSDVSNRLTQQDFQLPNNAWNNLKHNSKLYFKVGTTSSSDPYTWDNHMVSVYDNELEAAPCMEIVSATVPEPSTPSTPTSGQTTISASVGRGGVNKNNDVRTVQELLNRVPASEGGPSPLLTVDGLIGKNTIRAIEDYQEVIGINPPDGLISPNGKTINALTSRAMVPAM